MRLRSGAPLVTAVIALVSSSPASAGRDTGSSFVTLAIPADKPSTATAVRVGRLADEVWQRDPDVTLLDLERVLEGADPAWVEKLEVAADKAKQGKVALGELQYDQSASAYADAIVAFEQGIAGITDINPLIDALAQQGSVLVLQGDTKSAKAMFARALALDPAYRMPREPARVFNAFEAALKESRAAGTGKLTVYAQTGAAEVWIDGVFRGIAPFETDIGAGRHYVRVICDGYLAYGSAVEVKRGSEATVQASLRPTARLAKLEELAVRVPRNKESTKPVADLAAALQVERLVAVLVEDRNGSAQLTATLVDGVSGRVLARAAKAFAPGDSFFDRDVRNFLNERIRRGSGDSTGSSSSGGGALSGAGGGGDGSGNSGFGSGSGSGNAGDTSYLPGEVAAVETPPAVVGGWTLVGIGSAAAVTGIVCGIVSFNLYDTYRNKLPSQVDPRLDQIRAAWLTTSIVTDVSWLAAAGAGAGAAYLLVSGYGEMAAQEEVSGQ